MDKKYFLVLFSLVLFTGCGTTEDNTLENIDAAANSLGNLEETKSKVVTLEQTFPVPKHPDETMAFTFTMNGDIIEDVSVEGVGRIDHESIEYNDRFNNLVEKNIAGLSIAEASNIRTIGGASLTTTAFKNALKDL